MPHPGLLRVPHPSRFCEGWGIRATREPLFKTPATVTKTIIYRNISQKPQQIPLSSLKPTKPTPIKTFQLRRSFTQPAIIKSTKQIKAPRPTTGAILFVGSTSCKEVRR
jgi:hypothetical protein